MCILYLTEQGASLGVLDGRFVVKNNDKVIKSIPYETLDSIEIHGNIQVSTQVLNKCFSNSINVNYYTMYGNYWGHLCSANNINTELQRTQCKLYDNNDFKCMFAKYILEAKINNQIVLLRRYGRHSKTDISGDIEYMKRLKNMLSNAKIQKIEILIGFEGAAAQKYFATINKLIKTDFNFNGRSKRPPKDPYNSMICLGYSIIHNEIYAKLISKGLNPFFGFIHKDKNKHASLVSDLIEEWRPILVDSLALSMLNGNELGIQHFKFNTTNNGVYLTKQGFKKYVSKLEDKLIKKQKYLYYVDYAVSFRQAIEFQINQFAKAIKNANPDIYHAVRAR